METEQHTSQPAEKVAAEEVATPGTRRRRPWWVKVLMGLGIAILLFVVAGLMLYNFGAMGSSANDPAMKQGYDQLVDSGQAQPVERRFVIRIPGCTCHSTDPVQTEQHRYYRIKECMSCHGGGGP